MRAFVLHQGLKEHEVKLIHAVSLYLNKSEHAVLFKAATVTECSLQKCETASEPNTLAGPVSARVCDKTTPLMGKKKNKIMYSVLLF